MRTLIIVLFWICWLIITTIPISLWVWLLIATLNPTDPEEISILAILLSSSGTTIITIVSYYMLGMRLYDKWFEW